MNAPHQNNWFRKRIIEAGKHQEKAYHEVNELIIEERKNKQLTLAGGAKVTEFISCSYLGLDMDKRVIKGASTNIKKCGVTFSAARTRARVRSFVVLEKLLNQIFFHNHTVLFGGLHLTHLGFLPLLASGEMPSFPLNARGMVFILDKTVHASVQINRGLLNQFGEVLMENFQHLDAVKKLAQQAKEKHCTPILIVDGVGSMGGLAAVAALNDIVEQCKGYVYVDDAHGMSICGKNGSGYVMMNLHYHLRRRVILATSLSKAFGAVGGVLVLPTQGDVEMVKRFAPTYVFGGPPPLAIIDSAIASAQIHLSPEITALQQRLWDNVHYFDKTFSARADHLVNKDMLSPIRGMRIGDEFKAIEAAKQLRKHGFLVTTAMYPVVAKGRSLLRVALSAEHSKADIQRLHTAFRKVLPH